ncbi:MAG: ACT domain-containing protein [Candidatus Omnitrophica bacterium]|nr:ACT domain-containing protein [Candidatus Omnitrophota bacterium]
MTHIQLSVFLENKKGRLYDVCSALGKQGVNIRALTVAESDNFGVLRLLVKEPHAAAEWLKREGFVVNETEVVALEVDDKPGGLAKVLGAINKHHINVEYMYGFVEPLARKAIMVFRFDDPAAALTALKADHIKVITSKELGSI